MHRRRRRAAFTIIEILVVALILEILVLVALPSYLNEVLLSRQQVANSNSLILADNVQAKAVGAGSYDTTVSDYAIAMGGAVPINPCTNTNTGYTITATATTATVTASAGTYCGTWAPVIYSLTL